MNTAKLYDQYTLSQTIDTEILSQYPDKTTSLTALGEFINEKNITDSSFVIDFMKALGYEGSKEETAIAFLSECPDKSAAKVFRDNAHLREAIINNYCSVMANFIVFSTAQRKNLKDTASYNRHIDKALPEMRDSLMILFELGAKEGEYLTSLEKYFEFTYYVNTRDSWSLFNSLYVYEDFAKYVQNIREQFLGIYLRSNLLPESIEKFVLDGNEAFTNGRIARTPLTNRKKSITTRKTTACKSVRRILT